METITVSWSQIPANLKDYKGFNTDPGLLSLRFKP